MAPGTVGRVDSVIAVNGDRHLVVASRVMGTVDLTPGSAVVRRFPNLTLAAARNVLAIIKITAGIAYYLAAFIVTGVAGVVYLDRTRAAGIYVLLEVNIP